MAGETLLSYEREAWVIPGSHGSLWTNRIFDTEAQAWAYLKKQWERVSVPDRLQPTLANVRISATIKLDGGSDAAV